MCGGRGLRHKEAVQCFRLTGLSGIERGPFGETGGDLRPSLWHPPFFPLIGFWRVRGERCQILRRIQEGLMLTLEPRS